MPPAGVASSAASSTKPSAAPPTGGELLTNKSYRILAFLPCTSKKIGNKGLIKTGYVVLGGGGGRNPVQEWETLFRGNGNFKFKQRFVLSFGQIFSFPKFVLILLSRNLILTSFLSSNLVSCILLLWSPAVLYPVVLHLFLYPPFSPSSFFCIFLACILLSYPVLHYPVLHPPVLQLSVLVCPVLHPPVCIHPVLRLT